MTPTLARKYLPSCALIILLLLTYIGILLFKIPYSFSLFFFDYSFPLFIIILLLYSVGFLLPDKIRPFAVFCITMVLFALPLSYKWTSGYSNATLIGGMIPYKDGFNYYNGARFILGGDRIPAATWQPAWRPLFPGFLSSILFLTMENLQWTLAALVGLLGACCCFSALEIYKSMGAVKASIFATLLYFFIQPLIGTSLTELLGLALGCLALILLLKSTQSMSIYFMVFGLIVLMVSVSVRAGAFIIFPMLALWAGWIFRNEKSFSFRVAFIAAACILVSYLLVNTLYSRVIVGSGASNFGNFAYTIYGQVKGGIGWTHAASDLGTNDTSAIFQASIQEFLAQPKGLLIGIAKSYKDFFLPSSLGIFSFISFGGRTWLDITLWILALLLLSNGLFQALRTFHSPLSSLMVFSLIGIFLSIPFLPPIDGGRRFYASTMPFFFAVIANGVTPIFHNKRYVPEKSNNLFMLLFSVLLMAMTILFPVLFLIRRDAGRTIIKAPSCEAEQVPFAIKVNPGSYIDIVPDGSAACGHAPQICSSDFELNGIEKDIDDFYQEIVSLAKETHATTRLVPSNDMIGGGNHFFIGPPGLLEPSSSTRFISGCAIQIRTKFQSIYKVIQVFE